MSQPHQPGGGAPKTTAAGSPNPSGIGTAEKAVEVTPERTGTFSAMLLSILTIVPVSALLLSALCCLAHPGVTAAEMGESLLAISGWGPFVVGSGAAILLWVVAALTLSGLSSATRADSFSYSVARARLRELAVQLGVPDNLIISQAGAAAIPTPAATPRPCVNPLAREDALTYRTAAIRELSKPGMQWVAGDGYTRLWISLYRADEATLLCAPHHEVIAQALTDQQRLEGSLIPARDGLLDRLRLAVQRLDSHAAAYLDKPPCPKTSLPIDEHEARALLRSVRRELNDFVNDRFAAIITARNLLAKVTVVMGIVAYAVFCLAMVGRVTTGSVVALTALFLTGAIVGIFNWLVVMLTSDTVIPDYGLSYTRLLATPTLAGLAAIGGVFITNVIFSTHLGTVSPTPPATSLIEPLFALTPTNVIIAAIFGLTPRLVISVLQQQTDHYSSEIKSTLATQTTK